MGLFNNCPPSLTPVTPHAALVWTSGPQPHVGVLRCRRFISPRCRRPLTQDDDFWSLALQDLETCGQSQILRELEVGPDLLTSDCLQ